MLQELDIGFCRDGVLNLQFQHYLTDRNEPVSHSHTPMESASGFLFLSCMSCTWNGPEFILVRCEELLWDWRRASHPDFTVLSSLHTCCFVNNLLNILHWLWGRQSLHFTFPHLLWLDSPNKGVTIKLVWLYSQTVMKGTVRKILYVSSSQNGSLTKCAWIPYFWRTQQLNLKQSFPCFGIMKFIWLVLWHLSKLGVKLDDWNYHLDWDFPGKPEQV